MTDDERTTVSFKVDENIRDIAMDKAEHGEMSERIRQQYRIVAFGEDVGENERLKQELQKLRDERDKLKAERRRIDADLEEIDDRIARLEERIEKKDTRQDKYEAQLEMLDELLQDGVHLWKDAPKIQKVAKTGGVDPIDVINDLQDRNPSIPDEQYQPKDKLVTR